MELWQIERKRCKRCTRSLYDSFEMRCNCGSYDFYEEWKDKVIDLSQFTFDDLDSYIRVTKYTDRAYCLDLEDINIWFNALKKTFNELEQIRGTTHVHQHNMSLTFKRLIDELKMEFIHSQGWVTPKLIWLLVRDFKHRLNEVLNKFEPIQQVLMKSFTHSQKKLLLKPYWYDFHSSWYEFLHFYSLEENIQKLKKLVLAEYQERVNSLFGSVHCCSIDWMKYILPKNILNIEFEFLDPRISFIQNIKPKEMVVEGV